MIFCVHAVLFALLCVNNATCSYYCYCLHCALIVTYALYECLFTFSYIVRKEQIAVIYCAKNCCTARDTD